MRTGQRAVIVLRSELVKTPTDRETKKRWRDQRNIRQRQDHGCLSGIHDFQKYYAERSGRHPLSKDSAKSPIHDTTTTVFG
jgi:hypothetical protein